MLLKVGLVMTAVSLSLAIGVVAAIVFGGEDAGSVAAPQAEEPAVGAMPLEREESPRPNKPLLPKKPSQPEELPVAEQDWPRPSDAELDAADSPRRYPPHQDAVLTLTVGAIGLYDAPVIDSASQEALDAGVVHLPETPMPWEERRQKNVYLAGHRLGYEGTGSRLVFYNLDKLSQGDAVTLKDRSGTTYEYRVTEKFEVAPSDSWAMDSVRGRDIATLQTCTPIPTFEKRLVIRADRIKSASLG